MIRYTLYLNFKDIIYEHPLPAVNNRSFEMDFSEIAKNCRIKFEVYDNVWTVISDDRLDMSCNGVSFDSHILKDGDLIKLSRGNELNFVIMVYEVNSCITDFAKLDISDKNTVRIGKSDEQDIIIDSKYISSEHAVMQKQNGVWFLTDKSLNGTYINNSRISGTIKMNNFDVIYTVGLKMVFLGDYIAVNRKDIVRTNLDGNNIIPGTAPQTVSDKYFSRSPRVVEPLFDDVIEIEGPPAPQRQRRNPLIFAIGPSVTMPLPILISTLINTQMNSSSRSYVGTIASVGISAFVGMGWAIAHYVYNKKILAEDEAFRKEAYYEYIKNNELLLQDKQNYNNSILMTRYISSEDILQRLTINNNFLWNRNKNHKDFLTVRLGIGNISFSGKIAVPKQRFSVHKDSLTELPHKLYDKYNLHDSVVTVDLLRNNIIGIIGDPSGTEITAVNIAVQTAALHCYTDVKIAAFFTLREYARFGWLKWLPHTYSEDRRLRMLADDPASYQNVLYHINEILRQRAERLSESNSESKERFLPHYVVFCTRNEIFDGDGIEKYISMADKLGFTFILVYKKLDRLPNECDTIIQNDSDYSGIYSLVDRRSDTDRVKMDTISVSDAEIFARELSGYRVREFATGEIPNSIEYYDMIGIGRIEQWNLIKKYKENRVFEGIRSFVGIGTGGKPMFIDIHEKKYGPHGLVAGTTGSGKSETLQTFIISLALNYHPDEIAFILIDYKGGGMAYAFENMPHIAGMITNLGDDSSEDGEIDSNLTRRALVSVRSEIKYRQSIFNKYKVNHIDTYIRLFREGKAEEPLPHLIIISDEFAELKKEQPEFIKELVSTARVGRSLGIHLILATQKPGGVVDDEIWSNSRFKLCLRVQDRQDSMGMLKRPEAAYLTHTGRAYIQIGNDEVFEQFQTGYSGADYFPKDSANGASESDMLMMNIDGTEAVIRERHTGQRAKISQLKAAVDYIIKTCAENSIQNTRSLWLPELEKIIYLEDIYKKYELSRKGITAVFGIADDPERQRQFPAAVEISSCGNLIISGISGTGKTTMLQTMIMSVINKYSCEEAVLYILDFSSRTLKIFADAPHCGLAALSDDSEAVSRLMKFVSESIAERRALFNKANVGSYTEYVRENKLPLMMVIIDNFYSFNELYQELSDDFIRITRDCSKYGIQVIITCNNLSDVRYKLRQNFNNYLTLIMAEKGDYRDAWGVSPEFLPKNTKGRGLILSEGRLLEYQTALPCIGESESERYTVIRKTLENIRKRDAALTPATAVKIMPRDETYADFCDKYITEKSIPVGYSVKDISVYGADISETFCYAVSEAGGKGISLMLSNFAYAAKKINARIMHIKLRQDIRLDISDADIICRTETEFTNIIAELSNCFKARAVDKKAFLADSPDGDFSAELLKKHEKIFVFIDSMSEFLNILYKAGNSNGFAAYFEEYFKHGKGMGIYFIAGFDSAVYGQNYFRDACRLFVSHKQGIHLGGKYDKQKLFEVSMPLSQMSKPDDIFMGYTVNENGDLKIFVPNKQNKE